MANRYTRGDSNKSSLFKEDVIQELSEKISDEIKSNDLDAFEKMLKELNLNKVESNDDDLLDNNFNKLSNSLIKKLELTAHQNQKVYEVVELIKKNVAVTLNGGPGVGKTTVIEPIIDALIRLGYNKADIAIAAPTHTALGVITSKLDVKLPAHTVAYFIGLIPETDISEFDPTKVTFKIKLGSKMTNYRFIIVDEASMLNESVVNILFNVAYSNNIKLLFIGDICQLPPIKEYLSKVFEFPTVTLEEVIRQKNTNSLTFLLSFLRNDILRLMNSNYNEMNEINENLLSKTSFIKALLTKKENIKDGEGYSAISTKDINTNLDMFKEVSNRYISYTNKDIDAFNNKVKHYLFSGDELVNVGELFIGYKTTDKAKVNITNGYTYLILSKEKGSKKYPITYYNIGEAVIPLLASEITDSINKDEEFVELNGYFCECVVNGDYNTPKIKVFIVDESSYYKIAEEHLKYFNLHKFGYNHHKLKDYYLSNYKVFMESFVLITNIKENEKVLVNKTFGNGYAITSHKSQGQTLTSLLVNLKNIIEALTISLEPAIYYSRNNKEIDKEIALNEVIYHLKLIYVALSRATKYVKIIVN